MKTQITLFLIFLFSNSIFTNAQDIDKWVETNNKLPVEKIYLHTDREFYFTGDTIWFKCYLTDSRSGRLIPGPENIYINLVSEEGVVISKSMLVNVNGQSHSGISLPDTLNPGGYTLQAFTDYLLNFGESSFFQKPVRISNPAGSLYAINRARNSATSQNMVASADFFPEGGPLLLNTNNMVAFKAIDKNGYGTKASGTILDNNGETVATFKTDYRGMGIFFMRPEPGKTYHARINGLPSFRYSLESMISAAGIKIQLVNHNSRELILNIAGNSEKFIGKAYYIANMHRGEVLFYRPVKIESKNQVLKFDSKMLKAGINRLVLLNNALKPVSERLVFSDNYTLNELDIKTNNTNYNPRSKIEVNISNSQSSTDETESHLSMAVIHKNTIPEEGVSQTILSSFLINSELNGFTGPSSDYFTDKDLESKTKLRLLMLTNGWSSYFWNSAPIANEPPKYSQKAGIDLKGIATSESSGKPLNSDDISLIIEKDNEMAFLTTSTNKKGEFTFSGLVFNDTAKIMVQAKNNRRGQQANIELKPVVKQFIPGKDLLDNAAGFPEIPASLLQIKYTGDQELNRYNRFAKINSEDDQTRSQEMQATTTPRHFRLYEEADHVIEVPENESSSGNILDFLNGKVPGLDISSDNVTIRGISSFEGNSNPLFLVDGIPLLSGTPMDLSEITDQFEDDNTDNYLLETVKSIPIGDIDRVDILKSAQNLATFGSEGANGVIAIYTHRGANKIPAPVARGIIRQKIAGYNPSRKFYSPSYSPENPEQDKPDFRTTLYWDAELKISGKYAERSFYTSDQTGEYLIIVEGISDDGTLCLGTADFLVENDTD